MTLIAGNWKMYKGPAEAAEFCLALRQQDLEGVNVVVCPPYVSLAIAVQLLAGTEIAVAAQNAHWEQEGRPGRYPAAAVRCDAAARHDHMDMRMMG